MKDLHMVSADAKKAFMEAGRIPEDIDNTVEKLLMDSALSHVPIQIWYDLSRRIQEALRDERLNTLETCARAVERQPTDEYGAIDRDELAATIRYALFQEVEQ